MKTYHKLLLLILLLPFCGNIFAQQKQGKATLPSPFEYGIRNMKKVGTSKIRIRYAFQAQDLDDMDTWIDCGQLLTDGEQTQYSSYFLSESNKALLNWMKEHADAGFYPSELNLRGRMKDYWTEYQYSQIFVHGNELTEWAVMPLVESQQWRYKESYPSMKWTLGKDKKNICGYECQSATCHWRGRDYVAWFTQQIPLRSGPWKFGGLPGLIMKVYDTKNLYTWEAVGVENGEFPILQLDEKKFKDTTRANVWKMQRDYNVKFNELFGRFNAQGQPVTKRYPYNQLELE